MTGHDPEVERLREAVNCATVLEKFTNGWMFDKAESTRHALKYRRGKGEIIIINHGGRGWWDPHRSPREPGAQGDVFSLVQRLDPSLNFGEVCKALRGMVGISPEYPACLHAKHRAAAPGLSPTQRWEGRRRLHRGSPAWRYLAHERCLSGAVLAAAVTADAVREGPYGSAWFAHRAHSGHITGIEMRGPRWRGFTANGRKTLFRLPGSRGLVTRLVVAEAPIDAMSVATFDQVRADTLYTATAGGMGPDTITALQELLAELSGRAGVRLVIATDADKPGDHYATQLEAMADAATIPTVRVLPHNGHKDWNQALQARAGREVA
jgi:hypothetical protein